MEMINIHQAKTHLSRLIDRLATGGGFIIPKAGKPVAKDLPLSAPEADQVKRLGFMKGQLRVPADFDRMGSEEIESLFDGRS